MDVRGSVKPEACVEAEASPDREETVEVEIFVKEDTKVGVLSLSVRILVTISVTLAGIGRSSVTILGDCLDVCSLPSLLGK